MEEEIKEAFQLFDKHGQGSICVEELREAMMEVMCEHQVHEMITHADNGNGLVDYQDFIKNVMMGK